MTPLEQALDSFLRVYYKSHSDAAPQSDIVVEYWCRQEHLNLEAHADVDEVFFERCCNKMDKNKKKNNKNKEPVSSSSSFGPGFRYPTVGHVLYLTRPTLGRGPTCVFPPNNQVGSNTNNTTSDNTNCITDEISSVVTIPAVPGRVLRFPGNSLHAVPKPADVWFSNTNDSDGEEDEDDDDDDDEERSVVLFNTWEATNDDADVDVENNNNDQDSVGSSTTIIGPIGVRRDPMFHVESDADLVDMMMSSADINIADDSGLEVDEDFVGGMIRYAKQQKAELLNDWREKFMDGGSSSTRSSEEEEYLLSSTPVVYSKVHCQPRESWKLVQINTDATSKKTEEETDDNLAAVVTPSIRVPLMGDKLRRRYPKKVVRWMVPPSFQEGANNPERPFRFPLALIRSPK